MVLAALFVADCIEGSLAGITMLKSIESDITGSIHAQIIVGSIFRHTNW